MMIFLIDFIYAYRRNKEDLMNEENQLKRQMKTRHITMLALGGAIGAGLFKGSGEEIGRAHV